jgi:CRP-like cAMP-binding protein
LHVADKEAVRLLAAVPLFSECSKKELKAIIAASKEVARKEGAVLAKEGDKGIGFFLILDGTAKVSINGRARNRMGPGDFFGEISLIDEGPRSATVTAESDMRLLGLTAWVFRQLVEKNPAIARKMLRTMADRLRAGSSRPQPSH